MRNITIVLCLLVVFCGCTILDTTPKKEQLVLITTSFGDIKVKLYNETPLHRDNFVKLVKEGFYDSLLFHRVMSKFMIQGGDPTSKNAKKGKALGDGDIGYKIPPEFVNDLYHKRGALAAAREPDRVNPELQSSGCQFYIVQGNVFSKEDLLANQKRNIDRNKNRLVSDYLKNPENKVLKDSLVFYRKGKNLDKYNELTKKIETIIDPMLDRYRFTKQQIEAYTTIGGSPHLDGSYTVFGEVVEGMNVVDSIAKVATDKRNRPINNVVFSAKLVKR